MSIALLATVAGLLYLLACLNVSTLLLSWNVAREREYVTRIALGCSPRRLVGQSFAESLVVCLASALLALPLGVLVLRAIWSLRPPLLDVRSLSLALGVRELVAALGLSLVTACLLSLVAATQTVALMRAVPPGRWNRGATVRSGRTGSFLVGLQVALATIVGVCATLSVQSLARLTGVDTGFVAPRLWLYGVDLEANELDAAGDRLYLTRLLEQALVAEGVASAALSNTFFGMRVVAPVAADDRPNFDPPAVPVNGVSPGYFATLGIELLGGRDFRDSDAADSAPVAIVSKSFADRNWAGRSALGQRVSYLDKSREVVGVVEDAKTWKVTEGDSPAVFHPFAQETFPLAHLNVRFHGRSEAAAMQLAEALTPLDPTQALAVSSLLDWVRGTLWAQRVAAWLLSTLSAVGLLLASVGVYGVVSSWVSARLLELGVRRALGAEGIDIAGLVLRQGIASVVVGGAAGVVIAWVFSRSIESFLFGVEPQSPGAYVLVLVLVVGSGALSCLGPSRRALGVEPGSLLRSE